MNDFISDGKNTWRAVRNRISEIFDIDNPKLQNNEEHKKVILFSMDEIEMQLPVKLGITPIFILVENMLPMWVRCFVIPKMPFTKLVTYTRWVSWA